jgi:hypothetical protein
MRRRWWGAGLLALAATAALGVLVWGATNAHPVEEVRLLSGSAWLASEQVGQLTLLDGSSAEVAAQVKVAAPGDAVDAVQYGTTAYAVNRSTGTLRRVDGSTFEPSQPQSPILDARNGLTAFAGKDVVYALDTERGVLASADGKTLATTGQPLSLAARLESGGATVDSAGTLWVINSETGDLTWVTDGRRETRREASQRGHGLLTLAGDRPVLIDTGSRTVIPLDHETGAATATLNIDLRSEDTVQVSGSTHEPRVYAVSSRGVLTVCDLSAGSCDRVVPLGAGGDLGSPVEVGDHVLIPDFRTGRVWIVNLADSEVRSSEPLMNPPARFQLLARDGVVFYNDPGSERAGVLRLDGTFRPAAKYDPADPNKGLNAPPPTSNAPPQTTASAPGTTPTTAATEPPPMQPPTPQPTQQTTARQPLPTSAPRDTGAQPPPRTVPVTTTVPAPVPTTTTAPTTTTTTPAPILRIELSAATPVVDTDVTLQVETTTGEVPASAQWDFGDGGTAATVTATHRWTAVRTYQVSVTATMPDGRQATTGVSVQVTAPPSVTVPNMVGQTENTASKGISNANLLPNFTHVASNTVPSGIVISQTPAGGTSAAPKTTVNMAVSTGPRAPYDFIAAAPSVQWATGGGNAAPFGTRGDSRGYAYSGDHNWNMEDKQQYYYLETHPQWVDFGYIQGTFTLPAPVIAGDHFRSRIGLLEPQPPPSNGDVTFIVSVVMPGGGVIEIHRERNVGPDGILGTIDIDLTQYAGATGIRLRADAGATATQDWACWISPTLGK